MGFRRGFQPVDGENLSSPLEGRNIFSHCNYQTSSERLCCSSPACRLINHRIECPHRGPIRLRKSTNVCQKTLPYLSAQPGISQKQYRIYPAGVFCDVLNGLIQVKPQNKVHHTVIIIIIYNYNYYDMRQPGVAVVFWTARDLGLCPDPNTFYSCNIGELTQAL